MEAIRNIVHTDGSGIVWLIVEAVSMPQALTAIAFARARGCVGHTTVEQHYADGVCYSSQTLAEVRRVPAGT